MITAHNNTIIIIRCHPMRCLQRYDDREAASARVRRVNDSGSPRASYALSRTRFTGTFRFFFQAEQHRQLDFNILIPRQKHINVNLYAVRPFGEFVYPSLRAERRTGPLPMWVVGSAGHWVVFRVPGSWDSGK